MDFIANVLIFGGAFAFLCFAVYCWYEFIKQIKLKIKLKKEDKSL